MSFVVAVDVGLDLSWLSEMVAVLMGKDCWEVAETWWNTEVKYL